MTTRSIRRTRKHHRLRGHDYASVGRYFLTFCTSEMKCFLSRIEADGTLILGVAGKFVEEEILLTEEMRESVEIIEYQVMPNHVHILLTLSGDDAQNQPNSSGNSVPGSVSSIIGLIKARVTARMRERVNNPMLELWHEKFHDHVIRDVEEFERIREYIINNPFTWAEDRYHPDEIAKAQANRTSGPSSHAGDTQIDGEM